MNGRAALFVSLSLCAGWPSFAPAAPAPGPMDLCPVCGMMVAKYPTWTATLTWKDGRVQHFDGAKDLFKLLTAPERYAPGRAKTDLAGVEVTDFYDLISIDARTAFFVVGSDVKGPMGHELVPLATRAAAEEFLWDHHGKRILRFDEIDAALTRALDGP